MFTLQKDIALTDDILQGFIERHAAEVTNRYDALEKAYKTDYRILHEQKKPEWKPDNRIVVNFAKYIVDTMNGFFIGIPIRLTVSDGDQRIMDYIQLLDKYNDQDDNNAELSKMCSIFGKAAEMYYVDEHSNIGITYLKPTEAFMVYDTSIIERPREFVRVYRDAEGTLRGSVSDATTVRYFKEGKSGFTWEEEFPHGFDGVPATEYRENAECIGLFEPVMSMIDAYNKAISEKANDVDYFADAYLKVLGTLLEEDDVKHIRDDRVINFEGDTDKLVVDFLQKPNGDETQEHLIDRLERLIFMICMVANISDDEFGTQSGIAIKYRLQAMSNLAKTKERKFTSGMNRRYRLIFSNPLSAPAPDDWVKVECHFTQNYPANLLEEAQIAAALEGIVSRETQLKVLSLIDDISTEIERIRDEETERQEPVLNRMFGGGDE